MGTRERGMIIGQTNNICTSPRFPSSRNSLAKPSLLMIIIIHGFIRIKIIHPGWVVGEKKNKAEIWKVLITHIYLSTVSNDFLMLWVYKNSTTYFGDSRLHWNPADVHQIEFYMFIEVFTTPIQQRYFLSTYNGVGTVLNALYTLLNSSSWQIYEKGIVVNLHRGSGRLNDLPQMRGWVGSHTLSFIPSSCSEWLQDITLQ